MTASNCMLCFPNTHGKDTCLGRHPCNYQYFGKIYKSMSVIPLPPHAGYVLIIQRVATVAIPTPNHSLRVHVPNIWVLRVLGTSNYSTCFG